MHKNIIPYTLIFTVFCMTHHSFPMKIEDLLNKKGDCYYDFRDDMDPLQSLFVFEEMPLDDNDKSAIEAIHTMLIGLIKNDTDSLQELAPLTVEHTNLEEKKETSPNLKRKKSPKKLSKRSKKEKKGITWSCTCEAKFNGKLYNSFFRHIGKYHINDNGQFECPYIIIKNCNARPFKRQSQVIHHLITAHKSFTICCNTILVNQQDIDEHKNHFKTKQRIFKKN